jgi:tetratricopeptide (TPR) repeat protein
VARRGAGTVRDDPADRSDGARRDGGRGGPEGRRSAPVAGRARDERPRGGRLDGAAPSRAAQAWREASPVDKPEPTPERGEEQWILEEVRHEAAGAVRRGSKGPPAPKSRGKGTPRPAAPRDAAVSPVPETPHDLAGELTREVGTARGARLEGRLRSAAKAFERERYGEARQILRALADEAPRAASVRELLGLTWYRLGRWRDAARELEVYRQLTGETDQNPVLADCYRAQKKWARVDELWDELREASPGADVVAEGRIVTAGALADRGRLADGIRLLEKGRWRVKRPKEHHLRMAYALADLHERAGDVPTAREVFGWVAATDRDFADVRERLANLG